MLALPLLAVAVFAAPPPSALLEPYAGYDVVFAPHGQRVLGPEAAGPIEKLLGAKLGPCSVGDIQLRPTEVVVAVKCPSQLLPENQGQATPWLLKVRGPDAPAPVQWSSDAFVVQPPAPPCASPACELERGAVQKDLLDRLRQREPSLPWQLVRAQPGGAHGGLDTGLQLAQQQLATGNRAAAKATLAKAVQDQPLARASAHDLLDVALLAHEAQVTALFDEARHRLEVLVLRQPPDTAGERALGMAAQALAGEVTAAAQAGQLCLRAKSMCDVVPLVRALAATEHFREAGALLDNGPLLANPPRRELLKLRFGLASALNDAAAVLAVARRMHVAWPEDPEAADVLSTGLARAGRLREAIETLHDLARKYPERDIVLGRIAGLLNFLADEAANDPRKKADLDAIEARMRAASKDPNDLVARFVVATRAYYAGHLPEALPQLEALAKSGSRDPRIPLYLAMTHFWLGHQAEAQTLIQHAVEIGPSDPDVFYCRSQIVRKVNLPLAIADLERYEAMTTRPWSVGPKRKAERVEAELAFMKRGELPPDWDRPGPERVKFDPANQKGVPMPVEVREGRIVLPDSPTPTLAGLPGNPTAATLLAVQPTPLTGLDGAKRGPDVPPAGDEERPWLPIALLVATAAALGIRVWSRRKPS